MCSGYYDYRAGYTPEWPGFESYKGRIVHPQHWPEDLDYANKHVVVIGSGATAVTLAPEMAPIASHVTMLQRSPTYIFSRPAEDAISNWLKAKFPGAVGLTLARWKNILLSMTFYGLSRKRPTMIKNLIRKGAQRQLGPEFDIDTHLTPTYAPWDQRMCLVPDGDLFKAIRSGKVSIETDHIERFNETGILLKSGKQLDADVIVTATGLNMQLMGGMRVVVDGDTIDLGKSMNYKGMMYSDVPNLASAFGYTNASWTLKCELIANHVCRLLNYMDQRGMASATPRRDISLSEEEALPLTSGYVLRAANVLPKQGTKQPWRLHQNYLKDIALLRFGRVAHPALEFQKAKRKNGTSRKAGSVGVSTN
jgi:cation diffusion facilitator CzcD-associated flavoprotein CzcO